MSGSFWRSVTIFLVGGVLGTGFGVALGFLVYPFVFPPAEATETLAESEKTQIVAEGTLSHANPSDPVHYGKGQVTVRQESVFLHANFEVGPGPKFHVFLVPKEKIRASNDVTGTMWIELGCLRSFKGSQKYKIPAGINLKSYPGVVIWCEQFSVLISPADLAHKS